MTADTILVHDSEPISAMLEDNVALLSIRAGAYFSFNDVGGQIWGMLVEPRRVDEIFDALARSHDVDVETMTRDVTPFLDILIKRRLIRVVGPDEIR